MHLVVTCDSCGRSFSLFHGWLSRLTMKRVLDGLVSADGHVCKPTK